MRRRKHTRPESGKIKEEKRSKNKFKETRALTEQIKKRINQINIGNITGKYNPRNQGDL